MMYRYLRHGVLHSLYPGFSIQYPVPNIHYQARRRYSVIYMALTLTQIRRRKINNVN